MSSWADIVKFGQAKPQMEGGAKKTANKRTAVKQTKVTKPKVILLLFALVDILGSLIV